MSKTGVLLKVDTNREKSEMEAHAVYSLMKIAGSKPDNTRRSSAGHRLVLKVLCCCAWYIRAIKSLTLTWRCREHKLRIRKLLSLCLKHCELWHNWIQLSVNWQLYIWALLFQQYPAQCCNKITKTVLQANL
jgi:hypothetical protein